MTRGVDDLVRDATATLRARLGEDVGVTESFGVVCVDVPAAAWIEALRAARDDLGCAFFDWLSAVDELEDGFSVVAHVWSVPERFGLLCGRGCLGRTHGYPRPPGCTPERPGTSGRPRRCSASSSRVTRIPSPCCCPTDSRGTRCARSSSSRPARQGLAGGQGAGRVRPRPAPGARPAQGHRPGRPRPVLGTAPGCRAERRSAPGRTYGSREHRHRGRAAPGRGRRRVPHPAAARRADGTQGDGPHAGPAGPDVRRGIPRVGPAHRRRGQVRPEGGGRPGRRPTGGSSSSRPAWPSSPTSWCSSRSRSAPGWSARSWTPACSSCSP